MDHNWVRVCELGPPRVYLDEDDYKWVCTHCSYKRELWDNPKPADKITIRLPDDDPRDFVYLTCDEVIAWEVSSS